MPDAGASAAGGASGGGDGGADGSRHRHRSQGDGEKHEPHATSGVLGESWSRCVYVCVCVCVCVCKERERARERDGTGGIGRRRTTAEPDRRDPPPHLLSS